MNIEALMERYSDAKKIADHVREQNRNVFEAEEKAKSELREAAKALGPGAHVQRGDVFIAVREGGTRIDGRHCLEALQFLQDGVQTAIENMIAGNEEGILEWLVNVNEVVKRVIVEVQKTAEPVVVIRAGRGED